MEYISRALTEAIRPLAGIAEGTVRAIFHPVTAVWDAPPWLVGGPYSPTNLNHICALALAVVGIITVIRTWLLLVRVFRPLTVTAARDDDNRILMQKDGAVPQFSRGELVRSGIVTALMWVGYLTLPYLYFVP